MNIVAEIIYLFVSVICGWFVALFKALPLYEAITSIKEGIIAAGLGIPVAVLSFASSALVVIRASIKVIKQFV